jgi:hypothetical protein
MIYGYARVSTDGQSVAAQVKELRAAGAEKVFARRRAALKPTARSSAGVHARQNSESSRRRQSEIAFGAVITSSRIFDIRRLFPEAEPTTCARSIVMDLTDAEAAPRPGGVCLKSRL